MKLSPRYEAALVMAAQLHASQIRKGSRVPYVSHLLAVSSLVIESGGTEDQAIAGLLHDAVEDQGGEKTRSPLEIREGEKAFPPPFWEGGGVGTNGALTRGIFSS